MIDECWCQRSTVQAGVCAPLCSSLFLLCEICCCFVPMWRGKSLHPFPRQQLNTSQEPREALRSHGEDKYEVQNTPWSIADWMAEWVRQKLCCSLMLLTPNWGFAVSLIYNSVFYVGLFDKNPGTSLNLNYVRIGVYTHIQAKNGKGWVKN